MGWSSGGYIFDPVCEALLDTDIAADKLEKVLTTLIKALQDGDWDTESESADAFENHQSSAVVMKAFRNCDVFRWGTPEYDEAYGEDSVNDARNDEYRDLEELRRADEAAVLDDDVPDTSHDGLLYGDEEK